MPTSAVNILALINVGPLTTTFTASDACATGEFGFNGAAPTAIPDFPWVAAGQCSDEIDSAADCLPLGEKRDEIWSSAVEATATTGPLLTLLYYSPGYHCPSGWETAGVAAMDNGTASITGAFAPTFTSMNDEGQSVTTDVPPYNFLANRLTSALESQETAVICCPSGYTMNLRDTNCYTNFPVTELAGSTGCERVWQRKTSGGGLSEPSDERTSSTTEIWAYDGTTTTDVYPVFRTPSEEYSTLVTFRNTFDENGLPSGDRHLRPDWTGIKGTAAIVLFNTGAAETDSAAPSSSNESNETVEESAGPTLRSTSTWGAVGGMMAVWIAGAVAGVGLIAAL